MPQVRKLLETLEISGISREQVYRVVAVTEAGRLVIRLSDEVVVAVPGRQEPMEEMLPLVRPFGSGPDLIRPRSLLIAA